MGANVFANGLEVSCEKATNQSLAAMPDICLSPPSPPAGPIPIPYPNFSSDEYRVKLTLESKDELALRAAVEALLPQLDQARLVKQE